MDKKYEDKLREILSRDEKTDAEMVQTIIEFILLNYQYHMNKQFYRIKHRSNLLAADLI